MGKDENEACEMLELSGVGPGALPLAMRTCKTNSCVTWTLS